MDKIRMAKDDNVRYVSEPVAKYLENQGYIRQEAKAKQPVKEVQPLNETEVEKTPPSPKAETPIEAAKKLPIKTQRRPRK